MCVGMCIRRVCVLSSYRRRNADAARDRSIQFDLFIVTRSIQYDLFIVTRSIQYDLFIVTDSHGR